MSCVVFFFKQKTAYEMRISDWSSDVCSSDLDLVAAVGVHRPGLGDRIVGDEADRPAADPGQRRHRRLAEARLHLEEAVLVDDGLNHLPHVVDLGPLFRNEFGDRLRRVVGTQRHGRSEDHTSELQSLMRISYAVSCLKKQINNTTQQLTHTQTS